MIRVFWQSSYAELPMPKRPAPPVAKPKEHPPALIHTAGFDLLRDEGQAYADALERAGVKVHYVCHEHMIHHFYAMAGAIPYARTALKAVGSDIKAALMPVKTLSAV